MKTLIKKLFNISDVVVSRKCKKSLYKSTYKGDAFTKGQTYNIVDEDSVFFYLIDNKGRKFNLSKVEKNPFYYMGEYF